ncbi:SRPBCC family protein [Pseudoruegeria sp. HB172150]|uniref:SRPBCC family protein n=1 Tax=Pseudoruegeria sp. HB172150 TaxID=2721164 RepID=UPI001553811B|nr:SRPBCC family protein [Pseudoruegeria sp. HB172150]
MTDAAEADRTLTITRVMPAPRSAVWAAWTDPKRLPQWWGPRGFTCRTHEIDIREGGVWRFHMIGPDGTIYPNRHRFTRIAPEHAIDYLLDDDGKGDHSFDAVVTFEEVKDGTEVSLRMVLPTAEEARMVEQFGAVPHGYTTLDCLTEAAMGDSVLSLTRLQNTPPEKLWEFWTEPEHLQHWFVPDGMTVAETDFLPREGQSWRTVMVGEDGTRYPVRGRFVTVEAPRRLVFTHGWEDEAGQVAAETTVTVSISLLGSGSKLTLVQENLASAASRDGHREGWGETLDSLLRYAG